MATFLVASNWAHPNHGTSHVGPGRLVPSVHAPASLAKTNGTMGTACVTLLGMVAVTKRSRARVLRRAQRPINARDGKTIPQGALLGRWLFGGCWDCFLLKLIVTPHPPPKKTTCTLVHKVHELFPHEDFFKQKTGCYYRSNSKFSLHFHSHQVEVGYSRPLMMTNSTKKWKMNCHQRNPWRIRFTVVGSLG